MKMMKTARLHEPGKPLRVDTLALPKLRDRDVMVEVRACGVIPNMNSIFEGKLWNYLPKLPASVGLDAAGVITEVGAEVSENLKVGDRVYVNPWLSCGECSYCRAFDPMLCDAAAFQGYFGFFPGSQRQLKAYPYGGFSEYLTASPRQLVKLPDNVSFNLAARFGYIGTSFAALRQGEFSAGGWIAINGITGTLGVAATLLALGMGATRILGLGRNKEVLSRLEKLAPNRIKTLQLGERQVSEWIFEQTDHIGVDLLVDCSGRAAEASITQDALVALKRGARAVNIGALTETLQVNPISFMTTRKHFQGSNWFTTGEGQLLAEMVAAGVLDLSSLETRAYPLEKVNEALEAIKARPGGFVNIVVNPTD